MSDLATALRDRISVLEDEREELEDALDRVASKISTLEELLVEEEGGESTSTSAKPRRKPGRPRGSVNRKKPVRKKSSARKPKKASAPEDELWAEAQSSLPAGVSPSTEEDQARARQRFRPVPRTQPNYGVKAGKPEEVLADAEKKKTNVSVSIEDDL